jgi:alkanesulfonate monooxygenase SsuD/methylene tetrahydromethanopterin reductase-like flavin-dependent oxidoreductase (luciferase family)
VSLQIAISPYAGTREEVRNLAQRVVDGGLDGLIIGDGLIGTSSFPIWSGGVDGYVQTAWLAGSFDVPTYGIEALVLPARDPRIAAKQASSLNAITEGRFHLAVAVGRWEHDAELFGYDFATRGTRLDEGIRALQSIWRGEHAFDGRFWSWACDAGTITPCTAVPAPELWLAGEGAAAIRRAVKYGLPWQPTRFIPQDLAPLAREYFDAGGPSLKVRIRMSVVEPPRVPEDALSYPKLIGPPSFLADQLSAYRELGASYVSVVPGFDYASCAATIDALADAKQQLG